MKLFERKYSFGQKPRPLSEPSKLCVVRKKKAVRKAKKAVCETKEFLSSFDIKSEKRRKLLQFSISEVKHFSEKRTLQTWAAEEAEVTKE